MINSGLTIVMAILSNKSDHLFNDGLLSKMCHLNGADRRPSGEFTLYNLNWRETTTPSYQLFGKFKQGQSGKHH